MGHGKRSVKLTSYDFVTALDSSSVADPGSGAFLTLDPDPRSGIGFFPDPGSQPHIFLELSDKFLGKKFYNSLNTSPIFFFSIKIIK